MDAMTFELRKRVPLNGAIVDGPPIPDDLAARFPALWAVLTEDRYGDGSARQTATLTVFWDTQALKACLNDRDSGLTAWVSSQSLGGLLDALERGLQADSLDWRAGGRRQRRR